MKLLLLLLMTSGGFWWVVERGLAYLPQPSKYAMIYIDDQTPVSDYLEISRKMDRLNVRNYTVNVSTSAEAKERLVKSLKQCGWDGVSVSRFPVVVVNERKLMISPAPDKAAKVAARPVISWERIQESWFNKNTVGYIVL